MADVQGTCDERFAGVRDIFQRNLDSGADVGASVAVLIDGEPVVDLWGGWVDEEHSAPWERDTITNVWSTTKTMTFLCALMLADRGELDFHAPVTRYWPEFGAAGKEGVEVRHLMSHTAGLAGFTDPLEPEDLADWDLCTARLATQEPWWEPGSASGYHAVTQGYLIGEVVRRITGTSIGQWFADEVAKPLGADFAIGLPEKEDGRVSLVIPPPPQALDRVDPALLDPDGFPFRAFTNPPLDAAAPHLAWWRRAEIPAANGHGNARSVATIQSVIAGAGQSAGTRLLSESACDVIFDEQSNGTDLVLRVPMRFGMGYGLGGELIPMGPRACFWGGMGGSIIVMDQDTRLTVCYVMNKMAPDIIGDTRGFDLAMAAVVGALATGS